MADHGQVHIVHSPARERYEAFLATPEGDDVLVGYLDYVAETYQVVLTHTVIAQRYSGHGYAAQLVRAVLDDIGSSDTHIVPVCSYVRHFIDEHPEYAAMTDPVAH